MSDLSEELPRALSTDSPREAVLDYLLRVEAALAAAKQLKADADAALMEWIEANGDLAYIKVPGKVSPEDRRWYVKADRKVRLAVSVGEALDTLLSAAQGDVDEVAEAMTSSPFKQGHVKQRYGDLWDDLFRVEEVEVIKDGKPTGEQRKVLACDNVAFIRRPKRAERATRKESA